MFRRVALIAAVAAAAAGCRPTRSVTIGWDVPAVAPAGYRVLVDDRTVLDLPQPRTDPTCHCLTAVIRVPATGDHAIRVVAYNRYGSAWSEELVVPARAGGR